MRFKRKNVDVLITLIVVIIVIYFIFSQLTSEIHACDELCRYLSLGTLTEEKFTEKIINIIFVDANGKDLLEKMKSSLLFCPNSKNLIMNICGILTEILDENTTDSPLRKVYENRTIPDEELKKMIHKKIFASD